MTDDPSPSTIAVLDTNVFLHFQPIDQWDWSGIIQLPARLVVCAEVLRELDEIKDRGESRAKKDRARAALALAERAMDGPVPLRDGVSLVVAPFAPASDAFVDGLSTEVADDRIVAAAVAQRCGDATVVLVSNDTTPRLRAKAIGLRAIVPPDRLRLREEEDPRDAEIRRLTDRLRAIERTVPRPLLRFAGGEQSIAATVLDGELLDDEPSPPVSELDTVERIRAEANVRDRATEARGGQTDSRRRLDSVFAAIGPAIAEMTAFATPTPEQFEAYNREVERYHLEYPAAYSQWQAFRDEMRDVLVFCVELGNYGTAPAEQVDVQLRIVVKHAGRFVIVTPETLPRPPRFPERPKPPVVQPWGYTSVVPSFDAGALRGGGGRGLPVLDGTPTWLPVSARGPNTRFVAYADDAAYVRFGDEKLKHGFQARFGPFAVRRLDPAARGCSLEYLIFADNLPEPVRGSLHIRFA